MLVSSWLMARPDREHRDLNGALQHTHSTGLATYVTSEMRGGQDESYSGCPWARIKTIEMSVAKVANDTVLAGTPIQEHQPRDKQKQVLSTTVRIASGHYRAFSMGGACRFFIALESRMLLLSGAHMN